MEIDPHPILKTIRYMLLDAEYACSYCGTVNSTLVDASAGNAQSYIEDCQICCRPNVLAIDIDWDDGEPNLYLASSPESDLE